MEGFGKHRHQVSQVSVAENRSRGFVNECHPFNNIHPEKPCSIDVLESSFRGLSVNGSDYGHDDRYQQSLLQASSGRSMGCHESMSMDPLVGYGGLRNQGNFDGSLGRLFGTSSHDHDQISYLGNDFEHSQWLLCSRSPTLIDQNLGVWGDGLGKGNRIDYHCWKQNCCSDYGHDTLSSLQLQRYRQWQQLQQQERHHRLFNTVPNGFVSGTGPKFARVGGNNRGNLLISSSEYKSRPNLSSFDLMDFRGKFVTWAKDQDGCRLLQMKLDNPNKEEIEVVFTELIGVLAQLMTHPFANYLVQKLVEVCSEEQRTRMVVSLSESELIRICLDSHGTRAVQKLLEHLTTGQQISVVMSALRPGVVALTKDINGHHVIQHCLKYFSAEENKYLLHEVAVHCFGIATDKCGCCVLQSCVDKSQGEARERLFAEIVANAFHLAEDRYGNYVVQHVLGLKIPCVTSELLKQLAGKFVTLSISKYGSNVVEKCLSESMEEQAMWIVCELLRSRNVSMLLSDPFGNYVVQKALKVSRGATYNALLDLVRANAKSMRSNLYGKKILAWLDRRRPLVRQPCVDLQH